MTISIVCTAPFFCWEEVLTSYQIFKKKNGGGGEGGSITASGNILASGNISLKLFMAPLETMELLTFWSVVAENQFAQL